MPDVDRIILPELRLQARVGVPDAERAAPQEIFVDVELHLDLSVAGATDALGDTVDYAAVCELLDRTARSRPFRLIEAIAEEAARAVLERFRVVEVRVRVRKPSALKTWGAPYAAVEVLRRRTDA